jgi:hypothetical protein
MAVGRVVAKRAIFITNGRGVERFEERAEHTAPLSEPFVLRYRSMIGALIFADSR